MYAPSNFNTAPSFKRYFCRCETILRMQKLGVHFEAGSGLRKSGSWQIGASLKTLPGVLTLFLFFVSFIQLKAQHDNSLLVRMRDDLSPAAVLTRWERSFQPAATVEKKVSTSLNIWLLEPGDSKSGTIQLLDWLRQQPEVQAAQFNHTLSQRNTLPDDPLFVQQWQLNNTGQSGGTAGADLGAIPAWDITTGGLTPAGDTIVVAVIDGGISADHPDIAANMWYNRNEIPGDGIDNDENGYTDDFRGWNVWTDNDQIQGNSTTHGTPVSALIGARGNNTFGVTGINWNVKLMFVAGSGSEAAILEAYDYVFRARQRYNNSFGQKGAFVVAVNCSWGTDYGNPDDAPLWCAALDTLGKAGILSIAATANIPVDVDVAGDLPTTCPSDYLIAVTSLDHNNKKAGNAAWGAQHIDLGTYGKDVYTASSGNAYGLFSGTSFAAPEVSGAVGLLYSAPCPNLIALAKSDPAAAAAWVKSLILQSVSPNADLEGKTLSGGGLQIHQMLLQYENQCAACPAPFGLHVPELSDHSAVLKWTGIADFQSVKIRWRATDNSEWTELENISSPFSLENLDACTTYEFAVSAFCSSTGAWSNWSEPVIFLSDGCCAPPSYVQITLTTTTGCVGSWTEVLAATGYRYRIKAISATVWDEWETSETSCEISGLLPCTSYELQVQTRCDTGSTTYGASVYFQTAGCGSCLDAGYCPAASGQSTYEWIENVTIDSWSNTSGTAGSGYQNFTGNPDNLLQIHPQNILPVTITPGFAALPYKEFFRIYIDFNMDGDFEDFGELAFDPGYAHDGPISGEIVPPPFFTQGLTRMRVMMKYKNLNNTMPGPCESFEYGQVEDYCVQLLSEATPSSLTPRSIMELHVFPQPVTDYVRLAFPEDISGEWTWSVSDLNGRIFQSGKEHLNRFKNIMIPAGNWPAGMYVVTARQAQYVFRGKVMKI